MEDNNCKSGDKKQVVVPYDEYQSMVKRLENNSIAIIFSAREDNYGYPNANIRKVITKSDGLKDIEEAIRISFDRVLHNQDFYVDALRKEVEEIREIRYNNNLYLRAKEERDKNKTLLSEEKERNVALSTEVEKRMSYIQYLSVILAFSVLVNLLLIFL